MENQGSYWLYLIGVFDHPQIRSLLSRIPQNKLLQIIRTPLLESASTIHQDLFSGLKRSLGQLKFRLDRYKKFILVFAPEKNHPASIKSTFVEFCKENNISHAIENRITRESVVKGNAYWIIEDSDLLDLIKIGEKKGFSVGNEFGILSYNETPVKEIIRNGITVISADFAKMGRAISSFIINPKKTKEILEPEIIIRNSL